MADDLDTFNVDPEFPWVEERVRRGVQTGPETGFLQRRQTQSSTSRNSSRQEVRLWRGRWVNASKVDYDRVVALYDKTVGGRRTMKLTPDGEATAFSVRFDPSHPFSAVRVSVNTYRFEVALVEAI